MKNYAYDDFGNQTLIKTINNESKTPGTWNVEYNGENRPIKWTNNATNESIVMYYDYRGRRCGKLFYNSDGVWQSSVKFFYNSFTLIQESTAANIITKEFVWDPSEPVATRPLAMKCNVQKLNLLYTHDANKNVTEVFFKNPDNGLAAHYEYSPFGELRDFSHLSTTPETLNSANASPGDLIGWRDTPITEIDIRTFNPFRFFSEYHDDELNLIYYNYRHYDPTTGRFISRDPIEEQGGTNLYNFTTNNPINYFDFLGKSSGSNWFNLAALVFQRTFNSCNSSTCCSLAGVAALSVSNTQWMIELATCAKLALIPFYGTFLATACVIGSTIYYTMQVIELNNMISNCREKTGC